MLIRRALFDFFLVTCLTIPLSGLIYWIVGTADVYGASGLVFSWFGYLLSIPLYERPLKPGSFGIAVVVAVVYPFVGK